MTLFHKLSVDLFQSRQPISESRNLTGTGSSHALFSVHVTAPAVLALELRCRLVALPPAPLDTNTAGDFALVKRSPITPLSVD